MDSWGEQIFDNDDAANFAYELDGLCEADRPAFLKSALERVVSKGYRFDGPDGVNAVASAALIARELGGGDDFKSVVCGPSNAIPAPTREIVEVAERAVVILLDQRAETDWWFGYDLDDRSFRSMLNQLRLVLSGELAGNPDRLW